MVLDFDYICDRYRLDIRGIVHVGAHYGEEIDRYKARGVTKIVCFEPLKENFDVLCALHGGDATLFNVALGRDTQQVDMFLASNERQSSSVLPPGDHVRDHPRIAFEGTERVEMTTLNSFRDDLGGCNFLCIDVQGYEYEVLVGADEVLPAIDYLYLEVNRGETYRGNRLVQDLDQLLDVFTRVETEWAARTWGDALYIRTTLVARSSHGGPVASVEREPSWVTKAKTGWIDSTIARFSR